MLLRLLSLTKALLFWHIWGNPIWILHTNIDSKSIINVLNGDKSRCDEKWTPYLIRHQNPFNCYTACKCNRGDSWNTVSQYGSHSHVTKVYIYIHISHIDGLVQEIRNSSVLTMELRLSCTNPSICNLYITTSYIVCIFHRHGARRTGGVYKFYPILLILKWHSIIAVNGFTWCSERIWNIVLITLSPGLGNMLRNIVELFAMPRCRGESNKYITVTP